MVFCRLETLRPSKTRDIFLQLVVQHYYIARCDCSLPVLPPPRERKFHVAERKNSFYFLQHENLLRAEVVIPTTNNRKLQENVARFTWPFTQIF